MLGVKEPVYHLASCKDERSLRWPAACACCNGEANTTRSSNLPYHTTGVAEGTKIDSSGSLAYTRERHAAGATHPASFAVPYCSRCKWHVRLWHLWGFVATVLTLLLALLAAALAIYAYTRHGGRFALFTLFALLLGDLVLILLLTQLLAVPVLRRMMRNTCLSWKVAVARRGEETFGFTNPSYADRFAKLNDR